MGEDELRRLLEKADRITAEADKAVAKASGGKAAAKPAKDKAGDKAKAKGGKPAAKPSKEKAKEGKPPAAMPRPLRIAFGIVKGLSIAGGLLLTVIALMALVGGLTSNLWARLVPALVVALALPAVVIERTLPRDDPRRARGLVTDVLALTWLGLALLLVGVAGPVTRGLLLDEGDRYAEAGFTPLARVAYFVAGAHPVPAPAARPAEPSRGAADAGPDAAPDGGPAKVLPAKADAGPAKARPSKADGGAAAASPDGGTKATPVASAEPGRGAAGTTPDAGPAGGSAEKGDAGAARPTYTPAEIFRKAAPSVVTIVVRTAEGAGGGTGFFIDDAGTLVTNHHVVGDATAVGVKLFDGAWVESTDLLVEDTDVDLALLRVKTASRVSPLVLAGDDEIEVGAPVYCIGNPLGLEHTLTDGLVSARRMWKGRRMVQVSAPVSPGNSGGPVLDAHGEVIGVATLQIGSLVDRAQNLNLAVPASAVRALVRDSYPGRRRLPPAGASGGDRW